MGRENQDSTSDTLSLLLVHRHGHNHILAAMFCHVGLFSSELGNKLNPSFLTLLSAMHLERKVTNTIAHETCIKTLCHHISKCYVHISTYKLKKKPK